MTRDQLERILLDLAITYAPHILTANQQARTNDLEKFAYELACHGVLVLKAVIPSTYDRSQAVQEWVNVYTSFYRLFALKLFPTVTGCDAYYASPRIDDMVVLHVEMGDLSGAIAGLVIPFVANRQTARKLPEDYELRIIVDELLHEIAATNLPQDQYYSLLTEGKRLLFELIRHPVRNQALTRLIRPVVSMYSVPPSIPSGTDPRTRGTGSLGPLPNTPPPQKPDSGVNGNGAHANPPRAVPSTDSQSNFPVNNGFRAQDGPLPRKPHPQKKLEHLPDEDGESTGSKTAEIINRFLPRKKENGQTGPLPPVPKPPKDKR